MEQLSHVIELIDKAAAIAGNDNKLATAIGVPRMRINQWRKGVSCPIEDQALIAYVAGLDPIEHLARGAVLKHQGGAKGDRLMRVLGKSSLAIGAALAGVGANAHQIFSTIPAAGHAVDWLIAAIATMCIM